jgi:hypothetical protein
MRALLAATLALFPLSLAAQAGPENAPVPANNNNECKPTPVARVMNVPYSPDVTITPYCRHGHATPHRRGCNHTGGGNIDVAQPTSDTLIITMTGAATSCAHPAKVSLAGFDFDLEQCFDVAVEKPECKTLKMYVEARVIGLLRSHKCGKGTAEESGACASVACGPTPLATVCAPAHFICCGENLSINDHDGPVCVPVAPGKFTLHMAWHLSATHPRCVLPCKAASAEFAPDPAIDPLWISYWEPFHGVQKKDFGFQVIVKVTSEDVVKKPETSNTQEQPPSQQEPKEKVHRKIMPH